MNDDHMQSHHAGTVPAGQRQEDQGMNDTDRAQWIDNDEGLYNWWKSSRLPKRQFIRENRAGIDQVIRNVTEGTKPAHYLTYGD